MTNFEVIIKEILSEYGWLMICSFVVLIFKNTIESTFNGIKFFIGNDFNVDDIVYVNNKKCRIIRQSIFKTTFYLIENERKFVISNNNLENYIIEKELIKK